MNWTHTSGNMSPQDAMQASMELIRSRAKPYSEYPACYASDNQPLYVLDSVSAATAFYRENIFDAGLEFEAADTGKSAPQLAYTVSLPAASGEFDMPYAQVFASPNQVPTVNSATHKAALALAGSRVSWVAQATCGRMYLQPIFSYSSQAPPLATMTSGVHNAFLRTVLKDEEAKISTVIKPMVDLIYIGSVSSAAIPPLLLILPIVSSLLLPT